MWIKFWIILSVIFASINAQSSDNSVIIIGAGLSGYSAAKRLIENGFNDITILEATGRIGGRIYSVPFNNGIIDSGAQWVHGQVGNSIYELVSPHFSFGSTPMDLHFPIFVISNGTIPQQRNFQMLYTLAYNVLDEVNAIRLPRGSLGELFLTHFDEALAGPLFRHIDVPTQDFIKEEMHKETNGYYASSSWFDISARLNYLTEFTEGDQYLTWRRQGYITLFDFLTKKAPNPSENLNIDSKVIFNKKVTNIRYNTNDPASRSTVTCSDGSTFTARHVIFTGSLGVLKKYHETMFTPALPTRKVSSIRNIAFGNLAKFFMEFDNTWWQTPGTTFLRYSFMWTEYHKNQAIATNRAWMIDIAGVYAVESFPNLLQIFFGGPNTDMFELASDETVTNDVMWMLNMFLPHLSPIPRPRAVHKTKWLTNDNFLGSYSYPSMNQERNLATIEDLASSIRATNNMPMVLFAGEATSSEYPSMAHGAVDSGYRAANEIISFVNSARTLRYTKSKILISMLALSMH